jgi:hypothetical protein
MPANWRNTLGHVRESPFCFEKHVNRLVQHEALGPQGKEYRYLTYISCDFLRYFTSKALKRLHLQSVQVGDARALLCKRRNPIEGLRLVAFRSIFLLRGYDWSHDAVYSC